MVESKYDVAAASSEAELALIGGREPTQPSNPATNNRNAVAKSEIRRTTSILY
jgi:hypothetical protein